VKRLTGPRERDGGDQLQLETGSTEGNIRAR
jgi:hypothetical protein